MKIDQYFAATRYRRFVIACVLALTIASTSAIATSPGTTLYARSSIGRYWSSFADYWTNIFRSQSAVVLAVVGTGAVSLVIITRGKWRK